MTYKDDTQTQGANLSFIRAAMDAPILEKEHEFNLAKRWKDNQDEKALHELITAYMRLVVSMAHKFKFYGLPLGDLMQEGNIGLMEAAQRFDPDLGYRFSTYASWWIRASIQDYILKNWSIVRTGSTSAQKSLFFNLRRLRAQIEAGAPQEYLSDENITKIAKELDVKEEEVRKMEARLSGSDSSLNNIIGDENGNEWQDLLADNAPNPEEVVTSLKDNKARKSWLNDALDELTERERNIIQDRQLSSKSVTLENLGNELGISKERVRQIEQKALGKLKASLEVQDEFMLTLPQ